MFVDEYTSRILNHEDDILQAFAGLSTYLSKSFDTKMCFGLAAGAIFPFCVGRALPRRQSVLAFLLGLGPADMVKST